MSSTCLETGALGNLLQMRNHRSKHAQKLYENIVFWWRLIDDLFFPIHLNGADLDFRANLSNRPGLYRARSIINVANLIKARFYLIPPLKVCKLHLVGLKLEWTLSFTFEEVGLIIWDWHLISFSQLLDPTSLSFTTPRPLDNYRVPLCSFQKFILI